jgi:hypothetical protein
VRSGQHKYRTQNCAGQVSSRKGGKKRRTYDSESLVHRDESTLRGAVGLEVRSSSAL